MGMMIGDTAAITLLTGLPGSGKTQRMVKFLKAAHERGELLYVSNLNGLKLPHTPFPNPRAWRDLPKGSVLVVDEAQEFFRARRGGDPPAYLTDMERIRHYGIRLVLATQQPDYLDTHLRGLVGLHEHLVRENGKEASKIWRNNEVMDNVRSERGRARYDSETWQFEPELFALYESAQLHTMKKHWSSKAKKGMVFAACALVLLGVALWRSPALADFGQAKASAADANASAPQGAEVARRGAAPEPISAGEWAKLREPRIASIPDSAPLYDGRTVQDYPRAFCMASGEHPNESCGCVTQQGTRLTIPHDRCIYMAYHGPDAFDPYRTPDVVPGQQPRIENEGEGRSPSDNAVRPAAVGVGDPALLQQPYGGIRPTS